MSDMKTTKKFFCTKHQLRHGKKYQSCVGSSDTVGDWEEELSEMYVDDMLTWGLEDHSGLGEHTSYEDRMKIEMYKNIVNTYTRVLSKLIRQQKALSYQEALKDIEKFLDGYNPVCGCKTNRHEILERTGQCFFGHGVRAAKSGVRYELAKLQAQKK